MAVQYRTLKILGYPDHRVGDDGSVWTRKIRGGVPGPGRTTSLGKWRKMKQSWAGPRKKQYLCVKLCHNGESKLWRVATLVLNAFVGPCPPGCEARHFPDRNTGNNKLENLNWSTRLQNAHDKKFHGTDCIGERHWDSKLVESEVLEIRSKVARGASIGHLARKHDVHRSTVADVVHRRTWQHI